MLVSYFQNTSVSMTREQYFEMCEMLGSEPVEEEIPVDLNDFPTEVHQAFTVYRMLNDNWEGMSGTYMGKMFVGVKDILEVAQVDPQDYGITIMLCKIIDEVRAQQINKKQEKPASTS